MLPVTHGIDFTKLQVLLYTILLMVVTLLPFVVGMSRGIYLLGALLLNGRFIYWGIRLYRSQQPLVAMQTFRFSISYLMLLFFLLLVDHYVYILGT